MNSIKVALLGFGTVGEGVYEIVEKEQERLSTLLGKKVEVAGVLIQDVKKERNIHQDIIITSDIDEILNITGLNVVIEAIVGVEPGYTYLSKAMEKGLHVITANKELLAYKGSELRELAQKNGVRLEYEAAVAGGIPIISTIKHLLRVNTVFKVEGILNGTSNYILSDIRQNHTSFSHSLQAAQKKGYAEADPTNDIDGWDAFYKLMVVSDLLFGKQPKWDQVIRKGIREIDYKHILVAESAGFRIKHVASLVNNNGRVKASVEPVLIPSSHALYEVEGVDNAVNLAGNLVGDLKLQGPGAGAMPTASAIIEDLVNIYCVNDQNQVNNTVSFTSVNDKVQQEWLVIGEINHDKNLVAYDKWDVIHSDERLNCLRVGGLETDIRSFLDQHPGIVGIKIDQSAVSNNETYSVS